MKLVSACVGLAALGGVALSSGAATAAPIDAPVSATGIVVPSGSATNGAIAGIATTTVEATTIRIIGVAVTAGGTTAAGIVRGATAPTPGIAIGPAAGAAMAGALGITGATGKKTGKGLRPLSLIRQIWQTPRARQHLVHATCDFAVSSIPSAFITAIVVFSVGFPLLLNDR
jgi:hypothetical protein